MRHFVKRKGALRRLPAANRLVYTCFLFMTGGALATSVLLSTAGPGWTGDSAAAYYAGTPEPAAQTPSPAPSSDGPDLDLGDLDLDTIEAEAGASSVGQISEGKDYRVLLETTHRHLYMMPVMWLILAHVLLLTSLNRRFAGGVVAAGAVGVISHVAAPWLIRYVSADLGWLMPVTGLLLLLPFAFMTCFPIWEMWAPSPPDTTES